MLQQTQTMETESLLDALLMEADRHRFSSPQQLEEDEMEEAQPSPQEEEEEE